MQKKSCAVMFIALFLVIGCSRPHQTTGIITQAGGTEENQEIAQLRQVAKTNPVAAYDLGLHYLKGDGVLQNSYKAIEAFRAAADRGDVKAQAALGKIYLSGLEEMGADIQQAKKWLSIAASQGDTESAKLLKELKKKEEKQASQHIGNNGYRRDWYQHSSYRMEKSTIFSRSW